MGLLDLPAPLYATLDSTIANFAPPVGRFVLWGVAAGVVSMLVYHVLAPKARIDDARRRIANIQRRLWAEDEFARAAPLIGAQLRIAFQRVGLALPASLAALLPVMTLAIWLDGAYGYRLSTDIPPPQVTVIPEGYEGRLTRTEGEPRLEIRGRGAGGADVVAEHAMTAPVPRVEKHRWWNVLVGNPAGYLPKNGPVESVTIALPQREYLSFGPKFTRSWAVPFFVAVLLASLAAHRALRNE